MEVIVLFINTEKRERERENGSRDNTITSNSTKRKVENAGY